MPLTPGNRLGQYEVVESVGAGGRVEVYRARDTKLGRVVAIRVLPEEFPQNQERLDRFEREARLLAQLNHAKIATLCGLEEHENLQPERSAARSGAESRSEKPDWGSVALRAMLSLQLRFPKIQRRYRKVLSPLLQPEFSAPCCIKISVMR